MSNLVIFYSIKNRVRRLLQLSYFRRQLLATEAFPDESLDQRVCVRKYCGFKVTLTLTHPTEYGPTTPFNGEGGGEGSQNPNMHLSTKRVSPFGEVNKETTSLFNNVSYIIPRGFTDCPWLIVRP